MERTQARKEDDHEHHFDGCKTHRDPGIRALYRKFGFLNHRVEALDKKVTKLTTQGAKTMADVTALKAKIDELETAEKEREERDAAQDAVTAAQIKALQDIIAAGQPSDQAGIDEQTNRLQAVIDSLKAADPTPPVVLP